VPRKPHNAITDVSGILVGQASDRQAWTGCTVVLCERGATVGVDVRGAAPGTRETDLARPGHLVEKAQGVVLAGGSAFGLAAADGVLQYLEARGCGFDTGVAVVPIVPAAILFDLAVGDPRVRPDAAMGLAACQAAAGGPVAEGNVGAGTGATVGKILGMKSAMKAGLGTASRSAGGVTVGAIVAVNAFGDVVDPASGAILAGARNPLGTKKLSPLQGGTRSWGGFLDTTSALGSLIGRTVTTFAEHTVIGVIATDARLTKEETNLVASSGHDGVARVVRPAHTLFDGDTFFALATGRRRAPATLVCALAAEAVAEAIVRGIRAAEGLPGLPAWRDVQSH
jgi:L-aminopeptidase/D-esterase-like protein